MKIPAKLLIVLATALLSVSPVLLSAAPTTAAETPPQVPCTDPRGCPDLTVDASTMNPKVHTKTFKPNDCNVQEGATEAGTRSVLRFTFTTPNVGAGDLIVGDPTQHPEWFTYDPCHDHYHFKYYADYRLWTEAGYAEWNAVRTANPQMSAAEAFAAYPHLRSGYVAGHKQGFCVMDVVPSGVGAPKYLTCLYQGISTGWADEYYDGLDGQFIDVTDVPPGRYVLETEVNDDHLYVESDYTNNRGAVAVTI